MGRGTERKTSHHYKGLAVFWSLQHSSMGDKPCFVWSLPRTKPRALWFMPKGCTKYQPHQHLRGCPFAPDTRVKAGEEQGFAAPTNRRGYPIPLPAATAAWDAACCDHLPPLLLSTTGHQQNMQSHRCKTYFPHALGTASNLLQSPKSGVCWC